MRYTVDIDEVVILETPSEEMSWLHTFLVSYPSDYYKVDISWDMFKVRYKTDNSEIASALTAYSRGELARFRQMIENRINKEESNGDW